MAVISFSFLLLLGVAILSAGTLLLVAKAQTLSVKIARYELAQLETARLVQEVLDKSRGELIAELIHTEDGNSAFRLDDLGAGVKLDADILFDSGEFELLRSDEVEILLAGARVRLCRALERYSYSFDPPVGAEALTDPFRYLEVSFEGHADRSSSRELSNWALSSRRATTLLEAFVVPEDDAEPSNVFAPCRYSDEEDSGGPRIESKSVRVVASGRGAMDAGACGVDEEACGADRYALLRITVRMDRVFSDLGMGSSPAEPPEPDRGTGEEIMAP
jgi:outer membrane protein OmpA-like peptidoglycan-associated protein